MRVAVLTLTRDRLDYSRHCFESLRANASCDYDHFILDQGSTDGTVDWLLSQEDLDVTVLGENIGICRGLNLLLEEAVNPADYDAIVKFDNDCELLTPGTLAACAEVAVAWDALVSPKIHGLRNPPAAVATVSDERWTMDATAVIGGVFLAAPARIFADGYRHDKNNPVWGGDDTALCAWWRGQGKVCGYLHGYDANHYLTTEGQWAESPDYFARTLAEGKPTL